MTSSVITEINERTFCLLTSRDYNIFAMTFMQIFLVATHTLRISELKMTFNFTNIAYTIPLSIKLTNGSMLMIVLGQM